MQNQGLLTEANYNINYNKKEFLSLGNQNDALASHFTSPLFKAVISGSFANVNRIIRKLVVELIFKLLNCF